MSSTECQGIGTGDLLHVCFGGLGGHSGVVQPLTQELTRRGIRSVICLYAPPEELADGSSWSTAEGTVPIPKYGRVDVAGLVHIAKVVRQVRPRIVLCHLQNPVVAAVFGQLLGGGLSRVLLVEHQAIGLRSRADQVKSLLALPFSRGLVVLTEDYAARYPYRKVPIRAVRQMVTIPNGLDLNLYQPAGHAERARSGDVGIRTIVIGMMSRLTATKEVATLIDALPYLVSMLPSSIRVILRIAGDGSDRQRLEALVDQLGLRHVVEFCGALDEQGVVQFLQGLDIYVQATQGETLSTAILQAYAVGLPVVASDVEGVRNFVRDEEDGLLLRGRLPQDLAERLVPLVGDPRRRDALGRAARARVEAEFSATLMADRYLAAMAAIDPKGPWSMAGGNGLSGRVARSSNAPRESNFEKPYEPNDH